MSSSGMLRSVAVARTDVSEKLSPSINRVTRIGEVGKTLVVNCAIFLRNVGSYKSNSA
jgi:hypothetical protein